MTGVTRGDRTEEKKEKEKEEKEEENIFLHTDRQAHGPIKGSTRGPRGPKKMFGGAKTSDIVL